MIVTVYGADNPTKAYNRYVHPIANYVEHDAAGNVTGYGGEAIGFVEDRIAAGEPVLILDRPGHLAMWVDVAARTVNDKTECPAVLDGMVIRNCPRPCRIRIEAQEYEVTDGTAELSFEQPGAYAVTVVSVPHFDKTFEVTSV